jgi:hypothetical protein
MESQQLHTLLLHALEHEIGGVKIYGAAIQAAVDERLKSEWTRYLAETRTHVEALEGICEALAIDKMEEAPGRDIVRLLGSALVEAITRALAAGDPAAAQIVAAECVVWAETKDHLDWQLIGKCAEHATGKEADVLHAAYDRIEDQEDEHLYHSKGWCRELWIQALGLTAVLPPPEERQDVRTAIAAARAEQSTEKVR